MAGRTAGVKRKTAAKLLPMNVTDDTIAGTLSDMIRDVIERSDTAVSWTSLRVTVEPSTMDPEFHQLRVGVHVA